MSLEGSFTKYDFNKHEDLLIGAIWGYQTAIDIFNLDRFNYPDNDIIISTSRACYIVFKYDELNIIDFIKKVIMIDNYPQLKIDSIIKNTDLLEEFDDMTEEDMRERLLLNIGIELATAMSIMRYDIDSLNEDYEMWLGLFALVGEDPDITEDGLYRWFQLSTIFPTETFESLEGELPKGRSDLLGEIIRKKEEN